MIKVLFPTLYLHLACKQLCFLPSKSIYRTTKVLLLLYNFLAFGTVLVSLKTLTVCFDWNFSLILRGDIRLWYRIKNLVKSSKLRSVFPSKRWQLWETNESWQPFQEKHKRNILGTAGHETPPFLELTRIILHKFLRRLKAVTKKQSQEFSRTESRILGALSSLDEFLSKPQIRTHSGTVPETFWNTNVENNEPNEVRFQDDPHLEVGPSLCQSRHSVDSDPDEASLKFVAVTWTFTGVVIRINYMLRRCYMNATSVYKWKSNSILLWRSVSTKL